MVIAPIFIASGSGFSTSAALLRHGPTLAVRPGCSPYATLLDNDGAFNQQEFIDKFHMYLQNLPTGVTSSTQWHEYESIEQCTDIEAWPPLNKYDNKRTYMEQGVEDWCAKCLAGPEPWKCEQNV